MTTISPPPVTQPEGHDPRLPLGTPGYPWERRREGREHASAFLEEDPHLRNRSGVHLDWGGGAWYREQVGPALPLCFSFPLSLILAANPDTREFQMSSFLRELG